MTRSVEHGLSTGTGASGTVEPAVPPRAAAAPRRGHPPLPLDYAAAAAVRTPRDARGQLIHYVAAAFLAAAAVTLTMVWWTPVFSRNPFALLYAAVIVAAWVGGLGPGLVASALCVWASGEFIVPSLFTRQHWVVTTGAFAFVAVLVNSLESLRARALRQARAAAGAAEAARAAAEAARAQAEAARALAEAANRAKDEFMAVLSHELRTPLTPALVATAALAADPSLPRDVRDDLAMVRRNIELEARLIDDLLDLTRVTRGKLQLAAEPVDAHAAVAHVMEICAPDLRAKRLDVTLDLGCPAPYVHADPARVNQVLWNLVKNAVKFTPDGGRVTVRTRLQDAAAADGPPQVVVEVADTGLGIDAAVLPRVFDAFEQGDRGHSHTFGGLGLGLAISRALARAHGGDLTAASDGPGRGATFTLRLARSAVAPARGAKPGSRSAANLAAGGSPADGRAARPLRVLLVEDHEDTLRVVARLLRSLGHEVRMAETMMEGLAFAAAEAFDLIVSDLGLPDGSGHDLMRQVRESLGAAAPPGIALSGYGMEHDVRRSRAAGFAVHLTKPIQFADLETTIRDLTGGVAGAMPADAPAGVGAGAAAGAAASAV